MRAIPAARPNTSARGQWSSPRRRGGDASARRPQALSTITVSSCPLLSSFDCDGQCISTEHCCASNPTGRLACGTNEACVHGACQCVAHFSQCGGQCIHTSHCCPTGGGAACPANEHCTSPGVCECLVPSSSAKGSASTNPTAAKRPGEGACGLRPKQRRRERRVAGAPAPPPASPGKQCNPICGNGQFARRLPGWSGRRQPMLQPRLLQP